MKNIENAESSIISLAPAVEKPAAATAIERYDKHLFDCGYHVDQYPWECNCGNSLPKETGN